jgi:FtsX-like permease family
MSWAKPPAWPLSTPSSRPVAREGPRGAGEVAFGTRRHTLSLSVLWQTALPVGLGLLLATTVGVTLGAVLLKMTRTPVTMDWASVLTMTGVGAAVVGMVTLLSLPPLLRMMRPAGLRTE